MRGLSGKVRPRGRVPGTQPRGVHRYGQEGRSSRPPGGSVGWQRIWSRGMNGVGVGGGESLWASLGQAQNWSQWRFCLCNMCTRPFGENNPGSASQAAASRGAAASFLLFLARLSSCLLGSSLPALGFRAACAFQCLGLPPYRAAQWDCSPEARGGGDAGSEPRGSPPPPLPHPSGHPLCTLP